MAATNKNEQRKLELVQQLQQARESIHGAKILLDEQLNHKKSALVEAINLPKRIKRSFIQQPTKSFLIAAVSGLGASLFLKKKTPKKPVEKTAARPFFSTLALSVTRPILQRLLLQNIERWLAQRAQNQWHDNQSNHSR